MAALQINKTGLFIQKIKDTVETCKLLFGRDKILLGALAQPNISFLPYLRSLCPGLGFWGHSILVVGKIVSAKVRMGVLSLIYQ